MSGRAKKRGNHRIFHLIFLRRLSQLTFFCVFIFLFLRTDYSGSDQLEYAVNMLFRLDPFLAAVVMVAGRTVIALMLPALAVLLLALVLGRSFCGWVCPMGTSLDGCRHMIRTDVKKTATCFPRLGLWLFIATLLLALCGFHVAGYMDPFSILVRGLAQSVYPAFHGVTEAFFTFTYSFAPPWVNAVTEPVYGWLQDVVLPAERKYFELAWFSFFVLAGVVGLEIVQKRFFCRNVCPLGAMLGLLSGPGLMRGRGGNEKCGKCRVCASLCRMGAIAENREIDMARCNLCLECQVACPRQIIGFGLKRTPGRTVSTGLSRRQFMGAVVTGVLLPSVKQVQGVQKWDDPLLIRPPGAMREEDFVGRCVRCAECIQVCIGNALQPTLLEGGLDAVFTPRLVARAGYCEYNCTLCGQVCPTGAIRRLGGEEKHLLKIGHAWFDRNTCLPYAKGISCMVCEEHCPTPVKAIQFREVEMVDSEGMPVTVRQPFIVDDLCIGCGICENKCPLPGRAAITVTNAGEHRNPAKVLPRSNGLHYG